MWTYLSVICARVFVTSDSRMDKDMTLPAVSKSLSTDKYILYLENQNLISLGTY